jgi:hypothetical protein
MEMIHHTTLQDATSATPPKTREPLEAPLDFPRFEDIPPFAHREGVIYVSQPVFVGTDVAVTLTPTGMTVETRSDHAPDRSRASALCGYRAEALQSLAAKIFACVGGDAVRLQGKLVRPDPAFSGFIDIYRTLVFDAGTCILEYPYEEAIFEEDIDSIPRFITFLADDTAEAVHALTRDATSAVIRCNILDESDPVRFEGLFWMPLSRNEYRPGFFVPYEPDRFCEQQASDWMRKIHRQERGEIIHVDRLMGIAWP